MCPVSSAHPGAGGQLSPCVRTGWPASGASAGAGWLCPGWLAHLSSPRSWSQTVKQFCYSCFCAQKHGDCNLAAAAAAGALSKRERGWMSVFREEEKPHKAALKGRPQQNKPAGFITLFALRALLACINLSRSGSYFLSWMLL